MITLVLIASLMSMAFAVEASATAIAWLATFFGVERHVVAAARWFAS